MATVSLWLKNIIMVVLFASFLELILPSGSMQRFVRVIMGLFIMLAILNPVLGVIEEYIIPGQVPALTPITMKTEEINSKTNQIVVDRNQIAQEMYKKDLVQQIRATVLAVEGVQDASVEVEVENKGSAAGVIKHITVYIKPLVDKNNKIKIDHINTASPEKPLDLSLSPQLIAKIKNTIAAFYQIQIDKIAVMFKS